MAGRQNFHNVAIPTAEYRALRALARAENRTMARQVAHLISQACRAAGMSTPAEEDAREELPAAAE